MPLYAYRCTHCGHSFEKIQSFSAKPEQKCPECGGKLERPLSAPGLSFKGAGWYVNDYSSKGSGTKSPKTESANSGTETKTSGGDSNSAAAPAAAAPAASNSTDSTN